MSTSDRIDPFAPPREARVRYGIAASGPPVDPNEVETAWPAAEVILMWGDEVLHVTHVSPPRDVVLGDGGDYAIGRDALGADRLPIVLEREGRLTCVIPEGATGAITIGDARRTFAELEAEGRLSAFDGLPGARLYPLPDDASARVEHRGLTFLVKRTAQGRAVGPGGLRMKHTGWIGLSLAVHSAFLVLFYFMPPQSQALSIDAVTAQDRLISYMVEPSEQTEEPPPEWSDTAAGNRPAEPGARHDGDEGEAGDPDARRTRNRMGIQGDPDDPDPEMARERIREEMDSLVAIGAVRALVGSWNSPTSPYGADRAHGNDAMSALGALMGDQLGANAGHGGLGMRGTGRGAGGLGQGTVGLARLGTICGGCDGGNGYGSSVAHLARRTSPGGPTVRPVGAAIRGALSRDAIRRVVRRHLAEVRFCYEQGLQSNPSLEGRVAVSWIIAADGAVQSASLSSSELGSSRVEGCVVEAVRRWAFPAPEGGGVVGVTYPFVLQSGR